MSRGTRFRYALEPVLLTRQWDLLALLTQLCVRTEALRGMQASLDDLQQAHRAARADWGVLGESGQALPAQRFVQAAAYLDDLARQIRAQCERVAECELARDQLAERVIASQRRVDAVAEHKSAMQSHHLQAQLSGQFKTADDQWNHQHGWSV